MRYGLPSDEEVRRKPALLPYLFTLCLSVRSLLVAIAPIVVEQTIFIALLGSICLVCVRLLDAYVASSGSSIPWFLVNPSLPILIFLANDNTLCCETREHVVNWALWVLLTTATSPVVIFWLVYGTFLAALGVSTTVLLVIGTLAASDAVHRLSASEIIDEDFSLLPGRRTTLAWRLRDLEDACVAWSKGERADTFWDAFASKDKVSLLVSVLGSLSDVLVCLQSCRDHSRRSVHARIHQQRARSHKAVRSDRKWHSSVPV